MRVGQLAAAALELGDVALGGLGALHDLELDVLELALPPGQRGELVLDGLEVLGRAGAGVEPGLVAGRPVTHELHVGLGLGDLALHVTELGARAHQLVVDEAGLALEVGELGELGQVGARVDDLVEPGVDGLEVEQPQLAGGLGVHVIPPGSAPTTKVHGSVRTVLMWVSTLVARSPRAARSARSARASHTCSLAQCPASTR